MLKMIDSKHMLIKLFSNKNNFIRENMNQYIF